MSRSLSPELQQAIQLFFAEMPFDPGGPASYRLGLVDIKKEFRKKAMLLHPDRAESIGACRGHLEEQFKKINHAYDLLKDEFKDRYFILRQKRVNRPRLRRQPGGFSPLSAARRAAAPSAPEKEPWRRAQAATGGDPAKYFYFSGPLPGRPLRLGEYLFYRQVIPWGLLIDALVWQNRSRPRLGEIALELKYLDHQEIAEILARRASNEPFGQAAVRLGFINDFNRFVLLGRQRRYDRPLGRFFLDCQLCTAEELNTYIEENRQHNNRWRRSAARR